MDQSRSTARYEIEYATYDWMVSRCLAKALLYRRAGWMQFGILILVAMIGILEDSGRFGNLAALVGASSALFWIAESGFRKSAWIRTLELRIDDLQRRSQATP